MQVLELLSHVNKRVKGHDNIKLPLLPLLEVYNQENAPPLVRNFSLVYVEMACDRASQEETYEAVSGNNYSHLVMLQGALPSHLNCVPLPYANMYTACTGAADAEGH
jgi:hypothetical protein